VSIGAWTGAMRVSFAERESRESGAGSRPGSEPGPVSAERDSGRRVADPFRAPLLAAAAKYTKQFQSIKRLDNQLDLSSRSPDTAHVGSTARRSRTQRRDFVARPAELGALLSDLRAAKGLSLREVEEATGKSVSNAYLSQLENGKIRKPSPNVLHSLAEVYAVTYEALMEKAGYLLPSDNGSTRRKRLAAFAIDDLTAEEEEELLKYLAFLRSRTSS
jgi:HTH-type transcriptional regulator, competence development regulator